MRRTGSLAIALAALIIIGAGPAAAGSETGATQLKPADMAWPDGSYGLGVFVPDDHEFAFISGRVGSNPDGSYPADFETEARNVLDKITAILAEADMDWSNVVSITIYLTDRETIPTWMAVRDEVIGENRPSGTGVLVADLAPPEARIEVSAIAARRTGAYE